MIFFATLPELEFDNIGTYLLRGLHECRLWLNHSVCILVDSHPLLHLVPLVQDNYLIGQCHLCMNNLFERFIYDYDIFV